MPGLDDLGRRWERLAPRERRLLGLLGLTFLVCSFGYLAVLIRDGLTAIEARNAEMRSTLKILAENRDLILEQRMQKDAPEDPVLDQALTTYLDGIAVEVGFQIPESTERTGQKGKFTERVVDFKLRGVTVQELADFLQRVETRSSHVVTQRIFVKPGFSQKEKLDVELSVATYERPKPAKGGGKGEPRDGGGAAPASEEQGG